MKIAPKTSKLLRACVLGRSAEQSLCAVPKPGSTAPPYKQLLSPWDAADLRQQRNVFSRNSGSWLPSDQFAYGSVPQVSIGFIARVEKCDSCLHFLPIVFAFVAEPVGCPLNV